ncbi:MAG: PAS domain S-box protein [Bacteroidota bacterium]
MPLRRYLIALLVFSCLFQKGQAQQHEVSLRLKWWHQFQFAGYYAAVTQGFYEKEGLKVNIVPGDAAHPAVGEVLSGRADFGVSGCDLLSEYANGKPLVALGAIFQHSPYVIMSMPGKHINVPSDLVGKRIMASENQGWVELKAMFLKEGLNVNKLSIVNHTWNNSDLVKGKVDAMTAYRSVEPYQLQQMGSKPSLLSPINYGVDFYGDILFSSHSYTAKNPETVEKFRRASFKGWEYAMTHKKELVDYILTLPGVSERKVTRAALMFEADEMAKLILPELVEMGNMNEGRWEHILAIHQQLGLIKADTDIKAFIYRKKPSISESLKNIGFVAVGAVMFLFLIVLAYGIMVRKAVTRKTREQREALDALSSSEEKYRTLFEQASDGIVICNSSLRIIHANSAALSLFGYTREQLYQMTPKDLLVITENDPPLQIQKITLGQSMLTQRIAKRKDGTTFIIEMNSNILTNGNYLGFLRDVTQKNKADEQLKKQERQLDLVYNKVADCIFVLSVADDRNFRFISVNQSFLDTTGLAKADVLYKDITEVLPPPALELVLGKYREAITQQKTVQWEEETLYPTGKKTGIVSVTPVFENNSCVQLIGSVHDITEEKELEKTLDQMYRLSRIGVWEFYPDTDKVIWSPVTREIHEAPENFEPNLAQGILYYKEGESRDRIIQVVNKAIEDGTPYSEELQLITEKGNERWVKAIGEAEFRNGKCIRLYGSFQDIDKRKKTELAFVSSLEERNTILESIGDGFFAVDKNWVVTYWNQVAETMLHTPKEKIVNKPLWDVFSGSIHTKSYRHYHRAMNSGEADHFEDFYPMLKKWFEISVYPSTKGLSVYFKDITERKNALEAIRISNERYNYVAKATNDSVWDWDIVNDTVVRSGDNYERVFGYSPLLADQDNGFWSKLVHPDDLQRVEKGRNAIFADPAIDYWEDEYRFKKANGEYAIVYDKGHIIRDDSGNPIRMIGSTSDISERKQYEESLKSLNADLEKTNRDLAVSNQELEQFAYVASHDLQEPLRMVTSFLTQLEKKYNEQLDEKAHQYIYFAVDGAKRMREIILELLEFSRVGRLSSEKEEIDLNKLIEEICLLQKKYLEEKEATMHAEKLPVIYSYKAPILQVFQNLINNAIKYGKENVPVIIDIRSQESADHWTFSVADNGIGINEEYFEKIFIIFQRLHAKNEYSGTGMGLAIVKKIMDNLGGRIWVESEPERGSTFYFTIPK